MFKESLKKMLFTIFDIFRNGLHEGIDLSSVKGIRVSFKLLYILK